MLGIERATVLICTTDPLSFIPSLGPRDSAWLSIHLIASDIATSGFAPQYGIFDLNLPPAMSDSILARYWRAFHEECSQLGVSIVSGHTGRYVGCGYTIIGGGVMMAVCPRNRYLSSTMAEEGNDLILTKGAAIETTAVLSRSFPRTVRRALGQRLFQNAWKYLRKVTTVEDALTASSVGVRNDGVTAMHDATEGGVTSALIDLANSSQVGLRLEEDQIQISSETAEVCKLFRIDPLCSLSEGSLVIASKPFATGKILKKLASKGLAATVVGRLVPRERGLRATSPKGESRLRYPTVDPYWVAYSKATAKGWR